MLYIDEAGNPCVRKPSPQWEPLGVATQPPVPYPVPPMIYVSPPLDVLPPRFLMRAPVIKRWVRHRPLAVIEAEIARAVTPGLRPEQV